jgi:branched-chain amino acid transport system permease protein
MSVETDSTGTEPRAPAPDVATAPVGRRGSLARLLSRKPARVVAGLVGILLLYLLPESSASWLAGSSVSFQSILFYPVGIYVLMAIGLDVMVGRAGLPNLGYAVFFAVGAYTTALLTTKASFGYFAALALAIVAGLAAGCLLSAVSFRARGHYLAIITLGAGLIVADVVSNVKIFGGTLGISSIPSPGHILGLSFGPTTPKNYDWLVFTAILVSAAVLYRIARGRIGRSWAAIRDDEPAAAQLGVRVRRSKVVAFAIGGAFGGLAGGLYAGEVGFIDPSSFTLTLSVLVLAAVVLVGKGRMWSVIVGAVLVGYLPERFYVIQNWNTLAFGAVLALVMLLQPNGLAAAVRQLADRWILQRGKNQGATAGRQPASARAPGRPASRPAGDEPRPAAMPPLPYTLAPRSGPVLTVRDLAMQFGGLRAVDGVSFDLRAGQVTSLIGPNGAGKTTVINLVMGVYRPTGGSVLLGDEAIERRSGEWRARQGLARTFQNIRLFPSMTALENVLVAADARQSSGVVAALAGTPRFARERRAANELARSCLAAVGLEEAGGLMAASLSYGAQRRLEIARALALKPAVLLLDEPAAGSNPAEKQQLGQVVRRLADHGHAILLIEHDMGLVMSISERVVVMNFGVKIADGPPEEVRRNADVVAAYLGGDHGAA